MVYIFNDGNDFRHNPKRNRAEQKEPVCHSEGNRDFGKPTIPIDVRDTGIEYRGPGARGGLSGIENHNRAETEKKQVKI